MWASPQSANFGWALQSNPMNRSDSILPDTPPDELRRMLLGAYQVGYGFPDQWKAFGERNQEFVQAYPELMEMSWRLFSPAKKYSLKPYEVVCFALLGLAQQDFQHVLCLAVNAHGGAAQARVRTMFEHVVLAGYFIKHPEKTEAYVHFQTVERRKNLTRARDLYSSPKHRKLREQLDERITELTTEIMALKQRFGKEFSKKWTTVGFDVLSKEVGLDGYYLHCYIVPNSFVHASPSDLAARLMQEEQLYVESGPDSVNSDEALKSAHVLLLFSFAFASDLLHYRLKTKLRRMSRLATKIYRSKPTRLII
jgi:hypothetical protein